MDYLTELSNWISRVQREKDWVAGFPPGWICIPDLGVYSTQGQNCLPNSG